METNIAQARTVKPLSAGAMEMLRERVRSMEIASMEPWKQMAATAAEAQCTPSEHRISHRIREDGNNTRHLVTCINSMQARTRSAVPVNKAEDRRPRRRVSTLS